jgi:hypothetical protein
VRVGAALPVARDVWLPILVLTPASAAALDHPVGVLLPHRLCLAGLAAGGAEERAFGIPGNAGGGHVVIEELFQRMVALDEVILQRRSKDFDALSGVRVSIKSVSWSTMSMSA